jgi:hypothetical protein
VVGIISSFDLLQLTLFIDQATGSVTALIKMAPGARLPDHEHPLAEQSYVLEGVLADDDGNFMASGFVWRPAGSRHVASSPEGCLVLGTFQVPNRFFEAGRQGRRHSRARVEGGLERNRRSQSRGRLTGTSARTGGAGRAVPARLQCRLEHMRRQGA